MSPLHAIWASSIIGALLFFWFGWAVSRLRRAPSSPPAAEALPATPEREEELQRLIAEKAEAARSLDGVRRELDHAKEQVALHQAQSAKWQLELTKARDEARFRQESAQELSDQHRAQESAFQAQIESLEDQLRVLGEGHQDRGGIVRELSALQARLAAEQKTLRETRTQLEKAQRAEAALADRDKKDKARDAELLTLRGQLHELAERARMAEQKSSEFGSGLAAADGEYKRLSARFADAQQRAAALQAQQTATTAQLDELRSQALRAAGLETENARLQAELRAARTTTGASDDQDKELVELRKAMHDAKLRLGAAQAKEGDVERLRSEAASLREQLGELPDLRAKAAELDQLRAEHRTLRVDHAIALRRCEEQQAVVSTHGDLERRILELSHDANEVASLRQRLAALEPLALLRTPHAPAALPRATGNGSGSQNDVLAAVRKTPGFRSVAIANSQGLLVHGDGVSEHWEALAAAGGLVSRFIDNVLSLVPLGSVQLLHVHGAHNTVLSCWMSGDENEPLLMCSLGVGAPVAREVWQKVANPIHSIHAT